MIIPNNLDPVKEAYVIMIQYIHLIRLSMKMKLEYVDREVIKNFI